MSMPRDFRVSESKRKLLLELVESEISPFWKGHVKGAAHQRNVILHAIALAFQKGVRKPFKNGKSIFQNVNWKEEERHFLVSIAMVELGLEDALFNTVEVYKMAEQYADTGITIVYNMVFKEGHAEPIDTFETAIADTIEKYKND